MSEGQGANARAGEDIGFEVAELATEAPLTLDMMRLTGPRRAKEDKRASLNTLSTVGPAAIRSSERDDDSR